LHLHTAVQVSDTTGLHTCTNAGYKKHTW